MKIYLATLIFYEKSLPKEPKDEDLKNEAYFVRTTVAEYKELSEKLDEFVDKKLKGF